MNPETSFALTVMGAVFAGLIGFLWWFFRDSLQRLESRTDHLVNHLSEFKADSTAVHAVLAGRINVIEEKASVAMKKSEEHGSALLLLMPRVAVLEEEELMRQRREDDPAEPEGEKKKSG